MAVAHVQDTQVGSITTNPSTISLSGVGAGHQLILAASYGNNSKSITGVTGGGSWSKVTSTYGNAGNIGIELWWCSDATGGTTTVSVALNGTPLAGGLWLAEFSGVSGVDATGTPNSGTSSTSTAPSVTPTAVGDLVLMMAGMSGVAPSGFPSSPWTNATTGSWYEGSGSAFSLAWQVTSSTSAQQATWTGASSWEAISAALSGPPQVTGTGAGSFTFTGTAAGTRSLPGTGAGSFSLTGTASGSISLPATAAGAFTLTGTAAGTRTTIPASANGTITFVGTAAGTQHLTATGAGALTFKGAATGTATAPTPTPRPPWSNVPLIRTWRDQNPFTYCLYEVLTGQFLGTLPFSQVSFSSQLLQPGSFSGTIDVASQTVQALGPFNLIQPGRTALLIDYLGSFIWGGIIWTAPYDQDDTKRQVQVGATEIWSWFQNQRVQATDYSAPPYSGITGDSEVMAIWDATATDALGVYDPMLIGAQMLYDAMYNVPSANLFGGTGLALNGYPITYGGYNTPVGVSAYLASGSNTPAVDFIAENYPYSSMQQLGSALNQLATLGLGVGWDYGVDVGGSAFGPVTCTVNLSYPRRGRLFSQNNLVLDCQQALSFTIPPDATQTGNTMYEQGANGALSVSQNTQPLDGGYPILERIMSRSNIQSANVMQVLQQTGAADLALYSWPLYTPTVTTDLFTGPLQLGQFIVGDDCWWRIPATNGVGQTFCPRFPAGLNVEARIIAYQAQVQDAGTSTLQVTLSEPPSFTVEGPWFT